MLNTQRPEAARKDPGVTLDFHSMFLTLQGEGPYTGQRSVFIRLAGCNLQCPHCDTEYTDGRSIRTITEIVEETIRLSGVDPESNHGHLVVITGGEPLRQDLVPLIRALLVDGFHIQIESNGVFSPGSELQRVLLRKDVVLIVSPKTSRIHPDNHRYASAFKYVLRHDEIDEVDGLPLRALGHKASPRIARPDPKFFHGAIYVNPEDSKDPEINARNMRAVRDSCLKHGYIAGVQLHKLLDIA